MNFRNPADYWLIFLLFYAHAWVTLLTFIQRQVGFSASCIAVRMLFEVKETNGLI